MSCVRKRIQFPSDHTLTKKFTSVSRNSILKSILFVKCWYWVFHKTYREGGEGGGELIRDRVFVKLSTKTDFHSGQKCAVRQKWCQFTNARAKLKSYSKQMSYSALCFARKALRRSLMKYDYASNFGFLIMAYCLQSILLTLFLPGLFLLSQRTVSLLSRHVCRGTNAVGWHLSRGSSSRPLLWRRWRVARWRWSTKNGEIW